MSGSLFAEDERSRAARVIEALAFASPAPVPESVLADKLPDGIELASILAAVQAIYRDRGIQFVKIAEGWTFRTAPDLAGWLAAGPPETRKPTRAQMETLAIIAYHQPCTRAEVEEIRGVALGSGTLDALMQAGWVRPGGRREVPGRPVVWTTTETFLSHFGLGSLRDLPDREELKAAGLLDARPVASMGDGAVAVAIERPASDVEEL